MIKNLTFIKQLIFISLLVSFSATVSAREETKAAYGANSQEACNNSLREGRDYGQMRCENKGKKYTEVTLYTPPPGSDKNRKRGNEWYCVVRVSYACE